MFEHGKLPFQLKNASNYFKHFNQSIKLDVQHK